MGEKVKNNYSKSAYKDIFIILAIITKSEFFGEKENFKTKLVLSVQNNFRSQMKFFKISSVRNCI